ncbi:hypothetical protein IFR04_003922, partial [Cadophora malorum]
PNTDAFREEGDSWEKELEDDVRAEAEEKYGHVVHIALDPNSQGDIYLKFDRVQGGENAIKGLNGRYFGGRMISATPVVDAVYSRSYQRFRHPEDLIFIALLALDQSLRFDTRHSFVNLSESIRTEHASKQLAMRHADIRESR